MRDHGEMPGPGDVAREVLDSIAQGVVVLDRDWIYRYVNPAGADFLGTTVDALLGRDYRELYPDAAGSPFQLCYARVLASGVPETCVDHYEPWDRYFRNDVRPWSDGIAIFFSDVTEERRERARLLRELEVFQQVVDHADAEICLKDLDGRYVLINQAGADHVGLPAEEIVGRLETEVLPADVAAAVHGIEVEVQETQKPVQRREVFELRPGWPKAFWTTWFPTFDATGELAGTGAILTDITSAERTEEALAAAREESAQSSAVLEVLTRSAPVGIAFVDRNLRFARINEALAEMNGLPAEEHLGRTVAEVIPEIWPQIEPVYRQVLDHAEAVTDQEVVGQTAAHPEEQRTYLVSFYPVHVGDDDSVTGVGVIAHDISDRRRLEGQLRQSQKMEAVGQLAGGLAHDFNNLLATISLTAELARQQTGAEAVDDALQHILSATASATALTSQLLVFSRQQDLVPRPVDVDAQVSALSEILDRTLGDDVRLELDLGGVPPVVFDATQLDQVLLNLALNARDAMPHGGVLSVTTRRLDDPSSPGRDVVELRVSDTGTGMTPEVRERVFEPFFTTKEPGRGTGLGLAMVYGAVRSAGGLVSVYSEPGIGTAVSVRLPPGEPGERVEAAGAGVEPPVGVAPGRGQQVLVVEDQTDLRDMVVAVLRTAGYQVEGHGPETAAAQVSAARHDLVVTDVVMPGLSGPELARRVEESWPGTPVIFLSGYTHTMLRHKDLDIGDRPLLVKPFTATSLLALVADVFAGP